MKAIKFATVMLLSVCMVFTMMPLGSIQAMAIDEPQETEQQETTAPAVGGDQGSDVTDETSGGSSDQSAGDSKGDSQNEDVTKGGNGTNDGKEANDGDGAVVDDQPLNEEPVVEEPTKPMMKAPTRGLPSGDVSNGWIWRIEGEEGDYTLTFEYLGETDPTPSLVIPNDFYAGITDDLGDAAGSVKSIDFPKETSSIGNNAFKGVNSIENVNLEGTRITTIGTSAFQNCKSLKQVKFPSTLTEIGVSAFEGNTSMKKADFSLLQENTVTYSASSAPNPALRLRNRAFYGSGITDLNLPDQLNWVGNEIFMNCTDLKSVSMPAFSYFPMGTDDRGSYMFSGCSALEELSYREVTGRTHYNNSYTTFFPDYTLRGCTSLKVLDLSGMKGERNSNFLIRNIFQDTDLSSLEELVLPENPTYSIYLNKNNIGTFQNKTGLQDLSVIKNPASIGRVDADTFNGSGITEADMSGWTNTAFTTINATTFANCDNLTKVVIPSNITTISSRAFANDSQLATVEIHSKNLTSVDRTLFDGSGNIETVTIGKEADTLTGNLFAGISKSTDVLFEGENLITITGATVGGGTKPLKNLNGNYYVDESGVLYKLDDDGTATVAYIPPGISSYTVPATIHTPDNKEYTVDRVAPYFCNLAEDLTELNFDAPGQVNIPTSAFTGWTTSENADGKKINGALFITEEDWKSVSVMCDYPMEESTQGASLVPSIEDLIKNSDGKLTLKTNIVVNDKEPSADDTYDYKTGEKATYTIAISNSDNKVLDKVVRVYFAYDGEGYSMGSFPVGDFNIVNPGDATYPISIVETDTPGIYYYDITGVNPGQTLAFQNDVFYESPSTPGGSLRIWTETMSEERATELKGKVINPKDYMQLDWSTKAVEREITKTHTSVYNTADSTAKKSILKSTSNGDILITNLAFRIKEQNKQGSSSTSEGADYIRWVKYEDTLELPNGAWWDPKIIAAIKKGKKSSGDSADGWYIYDGTTYLDSNSTANCRILRVTANGTTYDVAYLYSPTRSRDLLLDFTPTIVKGDDGKDLIKLTWRVNNSYATGNYATAEFPVSEYYLRYGDSVLYADIDVVNEIMNTTDENGNKNLLTLHNTSNETRHYSFSGNQISSSEVDAPVKGEAGLESVKAYEKNNGSYTSYYGGTEDYMYVRLTNTGIMDINTWGQKSESGDNWNGTIMTDNLDSCFYIQPNDIEAMLNGTAVAGTGQTAREWPVGNWLTITIANASLFTPEQYQFTEGTNQTNKYATGTNISASSDNGARNYQNAKFVIKKNAEGVITVTLSADTTAANNKTYEIGEGKDYASIKQLFDAVGYMPTNGTAYQLAWKTDDFVLRAGQSIRLPIRATYKNTPMRLPEDRESRYSSGSTTVRNFANVYGKVGDTAYSKQITPSYYHYWQSELFLYKDGFVDGSSSSITGSSIELKDGTVVDAHVYAYNRNGKPYETISMHDTMTGAQVLLVPVNKNPNLKAPNGGELEKYTTRLMDYYLLNVPGTYENVVLGSTSKNGTQIYETDTIVVSKSSTSLNTVIHWKPFENWGANTSGQTDIWYKSLVSAEKAGILTPGGEDTGSYAINNKAWLGDHQGHRLWDTMGKTYQVYNFDKHIVTDNGKKDGTDTVAGGTLTDYSRLSHGKTVTYQINISNSSSSPTTLKGNRIYDYLPNTYGVFDWTRGDEANGIEANVTNLRYFASNGVTITTGSGDSLVQLDTNGGSNEGHDDYWDVIKRTSGTGLYDIKWNSDFAIHFPTSGNVKILVDVTFPERPESGPSLWDQFLSATKGNMLYNYFYLDGRSEYVNHSLEAEGKPVLYKGVYDTGVTTRSSSSTSGSSRTYTSNNSRMMYSNGPGNSDYNDSNLKASTVTYYTILYNGSYDRMYLSDVQDQLPKGFTFNGFTNYASNVTSNYSSSDYRYVGYSGNKTAYGTGSSYYNTEYTEYPANNSYALVTIDNSKDEFDNNQIRYANARVKVSTKMVDGREHLTFSFIGAGSNSTSTYFSALKYDSAVGKYYLNPGEAVRICYNAEVGPYAATDKLATNTVTMPYFDYYGLGFDLHVPDEDGNGGATQKAKAISGVKDNDGGCMTMETSEIASEYKFDTKNYSGERYNNNPGGNWLVSDATVERAEIVPGIQKQVGGLTPKPASATTSTILGSKGNDTSLFGAAYSGGCKTTDIVNWGIKVFNEGGTGNENVRGTLQNYTVTDTIAAPYGFVGQVFYNMYRGNSSSGTKLTSSSQYLFTISPRHQDDTYVTIGSGSSTGNSTLHIKSAEDDSDDEWFNFDGGKVKIERNSSGKEVMTIVLTAAKHGIPAGCYAQFCVHTQYTDESAIVISEGKYNDVVTIPNEQGYDKDDVAQGRALTEEITGDDGTVHEKNIGVQSGASVMLTQGYNTESWKTVTENVTGGDTARSDSSNNYIKLDEKTNSFRYDLYMIAPQAIMSKLVMIDDLPQEGDHTAFVEDDKRNSDFTVGFLESNLDFKVKIAPSKGGTEKTLTKDQYTLYVTQKTEFDSDDWLGNGDGWTNITNYSDSELSEILKTSRSFRVVIEDPKAFETKPSDLLMSKQSQIHLSFNAKVDDDTAKPGEYAWNSFGYKYDVVLNASSHSTISLEAQPLSAGVRFPSAPVLTKKLTEEITELVETTDEETGETTTEEKTSIVEHKTARDENFRFIIYEGEPIASLDNVSGKTDAEVAEILAGANRKYIYIPYTVKAGKSAAEKGLWTVDYCSKYSDGTFSDDKDNQWKWLNGAKYTLLELSIEDKYVYELESISVNGNAEDGNNKVFTNSNETKIQLVGENRYSPADLVLTKKMPTRVDTSVSENAPTNSTVVFKIVGVDKDQPTKVVYENTVGIDFNNETGTSETRVLHDVPGGIIITVTEEYSGNYKPKNKTITKDESKIEIYPLDGPIKELRGKPVWQFEFENEPNGSAFGSGIVNKYLNTDGTVSYDNGKN